MADDSYTDGHTVLVEHGPDGQSVFGPVGPLPGTPLGAAALWVLAVRNLPATRPAFLDLTVDGDRWRQLDRHRDALSGRVLARRAVISKPDELTAVVTVLPAGMTTDPGSWPIPGAGAIKLRRFPDAYWRVTRFNPA